MATLPLPTFSLAAYDKDPNRERITTTEREVLQAMLDMFTAAKHKPATMATLLQEACNTGDTAAIVAAANEASKSSVRREFGSDDLEVYICGVFLGRDLDNSIGIGILRDATCMTYVGMMKAGVPNGLGHTSAAEFSFAGRMGRHGITGYGLMATRDEFFTGWFRNGTRHGWGQRSSQRRPALDFHVLYVDGRVASNAEHQASSAREKRVIVSATAKARDLGMGCWL